MMARRVAQTGRIVIVQENALRTAEKTGRGWGLPMVDSRSENVLGARGREKTQEKW